MLGGFCLFVTGKYRYNYEKIISIPVPASFSEKIQLGTKIIKTESIRKLSNFNFQWTKTLCQNNLNNIAFFFYIFQGL